MINTNNLKKKIGSLKFQQISKHKIINLSWAIKAVLKILIN